MGVINNFEKDVKDRLAADGVSQLEIAGEIGTSKAYVNRIIKGNVCIINKMFVSLMEALGYDVKVVYIKRDGTEDPVDEEVLKKAVDRAVEKSLPGIKRRVMQEFKTLETKSPVYRKNI